MEKSPLGNVSDWQRKGDTDLFVGIHLIVVFETMPEMLILQFLPMKKNVIATIRILAACLEEISQHGNSAVGRGYWEWIFGMAGRSEEI